MFPYLKGGGKKGGQGGEDGEDLVSIKLILLYISTKSLDEK